MSLAKDMEVFMVLRKLRRRSGIALVEVQSEGSKHVEHLDLLRQPSSHDVAVATAAAAAKAGI